MVLRNRSFLITLTICSILTFFLLLTYGSSSVEIDIVAVPINVVDGDTFDAHPVGRIRLADVDAPDNGSGYKEAKAFLKNLLGNASNGRVYLDVDDRNLIDKFNRPVCVVYIVHNLTHLKNVNKALVEEGLANITDYDNDFDPYEWTTFVYYPLPDSGKNYREVLLSFFTNELVAHGAMFFAASTATFIFINGTITARDKVNKHFLRGTVFILFIGVLLGLTIFLGFRQVYYGALTNGAIHLKRDPSEYESLSDYSNKVANYACEGFLLGKNLWRTIEEGIRPRGILPVSISIGLFVGYLLLITFISDSPIQKSSVFWLLLYFTIPIFTGFIGVCYFSDPLVPIAIIWYLIGVLWKLGKVRNRATNT